jgi:hypothetical protein
MMWSGVFVFGVVAAGVVALSREPVPHSLETPLSAETSP